MKMKKITGMLVATAMVGTMLVGCGSASSNSYITLISREEGSGTRGAFVEITGVEAKDESGNKVDNTSVDAVIENGTSIIMTSVSGDENAIGYISLGSLNDTVKAVAIDGVEATVENVISGAYGVSRPFNIVMLEDMDNEAAIDFTNFILSTQGQEVVGNNGCIALTEGLEEYVVSDISGTFTVGGSSSVYPVMEKLKEAYEELNPNVSVNIELSDSTAGMTMTAEKNYDIGMASREVKDEEIALGLVPSVMAIDGIGVIVNQENTIESLTIDQVRDIYTGAITSWDEL